jgi:hypothetical protein
LNPEFQETRQKKKESNQHKRRARERRVGIVGD